MQENLIDVYRFMVHPVVLGEGRRLFAGEGSRRPLTLTATKQLSTGILILEYTPAN
jgi:dihydrofolate reductase